MFKIKFSFFWRVWGFFSRGNPGHRILHPATREDALWQDKKFPQANIQLNGVRHTIIFLCVFYIEYIRIILSQNS